MKRITPHWTAGSHKVSALDRKHYHFIIDGDGKVHAGDLAPEANLDTSDGHYAAHTRGANTKNIGIAVAAMAGAVERPFSPGKFPITEKQIDALVGLIADLCDLYEIPVSRHTVLTHAEWQLTMGVKQRGKWDITWLPGMARPGDPVEVGDRLRAMVVRRMESEFSAPPPDPVRTALEDADKPAFKSKTNWSALGAAAAGVLGSVSDFFEGMSDTVQIVALVAILIAVAIIIFERRGKALLGRAARWD